MKKFIPTIFFLGLIAWGASLWIIALGHADLMPIGRQRSFGIVTNLFFLVTTVGGLLWAMVKSRMLLLLMTALFGLWILTFLAFGFSPYVLGLFGSPSEEKIRSTAEANGYSKEWIDKALTGPAVSAATGYMVDTYQWVLLAEVKHPK